MHLFVFAFIAGILAGLIIAGLLLCAFYIFTKKRGERPANEEMEEIELQRNEEPELSSSIPSIVESKVFKDEETRVEFSYVPSSANSLGTGGYGSVFKGICLQDQSEVAIKRVSRLKFKDDQQARKYFKREVETLKVGSRVSRNVTKLFGSRVDDVGLTLAIEYCDGGELSRDLFTGAGTFVNLATVLEVYVQLASALLSLRENGIVHRDLKPSNVFFTWRASHFARGNLRCVINNYVRGSVEKRHRPEAPFAVKLGDFGLARFLNDSEELTKAVGTRRYMAPEVRRGSSYGTQSDLYSLGVMFEEDLEHAGACMEWHTTWRDLTQLALSLTSSDERDRPSLETFIAALTNFAYVEDKGEQVLSEDDDPLILIKHTRTVRMDDGTVRRETCKLVPWDSPYYRQFPGGANEVRYETSVVESQPSLEQ